MGSGKQWSSDEGEQEKETLLQMREDRSIHPEQLSGDQMGEKSVFATLSQNSKANMLLTSTAVIKTIIGSGILAIPYSLSKMGYLFGTLIFFVSVVLNQFSSVLLLKAKNLSGHSNYSSILYSIWRHKVGKALVSLLIVLGNIGVCIAQLIIFKTTIRKILNDLMPNDPALEQFYTSQYFLVLVMALLQAPLAFVTKIQKFKFLNFIGVAGIITFMITLLLFFILSITDSDPNNNPAGGMTMFPNNWFEAAAAVPNFILSLEFHFNFFPIYKGLKDPTDKKMSNATLFSVLFCFFAYLLTGIIGYDYAGQNTKTNFLQSINFQTTSKAFFFILNASFLTSVFFSFPLLFFSSRDNFVAVGKAIFSKTSQKENDIEEVSSFIEGNRQNQLKRKVKVQFFLYTLALYLVTVVIALFVDNLLVVFNMIGAISSNSTCILLPCFFYFRLVSLRKTQKGFKYYISIVTFWVMGLYAVFSIVALYI